MNIRVLNEADAPAFREVRLRSLREHPEAFGASYEEESELPLERFAERLRADPGTSIAFGAFDGQSLVGTVRLGLETRRKTRHKATLLSVYVAPEARGQGVARALLEAALHQARELGVEDVVLGVTVGNTAARALYASLGFEGYGIEPRYIKLGDEYTDIEFMILHLGRGGSGN